MRAAICQYQIAWEDKSANYKRAAEYIEQAAAERAELIAFPEMSFTGFTMNRKMAEDESRPSLAFMKAQAEKHGICVAAGYTVLCGEKAQNRYAVVDECGNLRLEYTKLHPFSYSGEDVHYESGNRLVAAKVAGTSLGVQICYDLRFPEPFLKLSEYAHVILVPANWPERRSEQWKALLRARAIENQAYVIGINCVGEIGDLRYSGDSCLVTPLGDVTFAKEGEGITIVEFEDDVEKKRNKFPVRKDRRERFYQEVKVEYAEI